MRLTARPFAALLLLTLVLTPRLALASQAARSAAAPAVAPLPRVRLVATGGTISNRTGGRLTAEELIGSIPGLDRYVRPEFEQFANVASSSLTLKQWIELARRINTLFKEDPDLSGVVVTSGTDTLEETAYFLDLTVRSDKPVVVVGSMRNPSTLGYEGATSGTQGEGIQYAIGEGVFVVTSTWTGSGRIAARRRPTTPGQPVYQIAAEDLAPVKARILLMLALTKTKDGSEIQRMFTEY